MHSITPPLFIIKILGFVMSEISNRKRTFIKRNFKHLPIEELAHKTGLKPHVIKSLIDQYSKIPGKGQSAQMKNGADTRLSWKTILLTSLLFAAVALVIYYPSLHGDFIFDDVVIQENPLIHINKLSQLTDLMFSKEIGRRIGFISFALNYYFGGLNTFGYLLVNVIIHILNGIVLFLLSYTILTLSPDKEKGRENTFKIAFLGSFIWLVHPLQTQAVSYIVQRLTSLSALFFLLSLLFYIKGRVIHSSKRVVLFLLSLLFGLLALGTKQNAATLPFFIVLSEFFLFQPQSFKMDKKKLGFILLLVGLFVLISWIYLGSDFISRLALQYEKRGWTPLERMMTQWRVVIFYISLLIYPHPSRLNLDHDFSVSHALFSPPTTILSLLFIIGFLCLAIFSMRRNRLLAFAIFWFFGNLVIESSIIPLELVFEHRLYLPSMGLILLFSGFCFRVSRREWERWVTVLIILLISLFSYWTYERASVWRGQISLWKNVVQKSPYKARPHSNLGAAYKNKGMLDEAISEFKQALTINPYYVWAHYNLGRTYADKGMLKKAISEYKKTLTIEPNYAKASNNLAWIYATSPKAIIRNGDEAVVLATRACELTDFKETEALDTLAAAYAEQGKFDKAVEYQHRAIELAPPQIEKDLQKRLQLYKLGRAYRQDQ